MMLRINVPANAAAAKAYYSKGEGYYRFGEGVDYVGPWRGKLARILGLDVRTPTMEDFHLLCDNINPITLKQLTPGGNRQLQDRRPLYDFTWSVPKPVGLLRRLAKDDRIEKVIWDTVDQTMEDMQEEFGVRVRKGGADHDAITGNGLWCGHYHPYARPVNGEPDPGGDHVHVTVMNATQDLDGSLKALQVGHVKARAPYWQAVWHARLAKGMRELGYETKRTKDAFDVVGVSKELSERFSQRTAVVERFAKMLGITNPDVKATLGATTREKKSNRWTQQELWDRWMQRMTPSELAELERVVANSYVKKGPVAEQNEKAFAYGLDHHLYRESVVLEDRVLIEALKNGIGQVSIEGLRKEMDNRKDLIRAVHDKRKVVTTHEVLAEELAVLDFAQKGRGRLKPLASPSRESETTTLSKEQQAARDHIWGSRDAITILRGKQGAGKTKMTVETVAGIKAGGTDVVMLAPSSSASRGTLAAEGFPDATTVAAFLGSEELQARARNNSIWIDEAGMLGFRDMAKVIQLADQLNARVIISGDRRQNRSPARGEPLAILEDLAGLPVAELKENWRQKPADYRAAANLLSAGKIVDGFKALDKMGAIKESIGHKLLVDEYMDALKAKKSVVVLSPTHKEGEAITAEIRKRLKEPQGKKKKGIIHGEEKEFQRLVPLQWTDAQKNDETAEPDMVAQLHASVSGLHAGSRIKLDELRHRPGGSLPVSRFSVYRTDSITLAAGDLIRITGNGWTKDKKHRLNNGMVYPVKSVKGEDIVLSNGWVIDKDFGHIAPGYVLTSFGGQGKTADRVLVALSSDSFGAVNAREFYVDATRGRDSISIFTDSKKRLIEVIQRETPRLHAVDLVGVPKPIKKPSWKKRVKKFLENVKQAAMVWRHGQEREQEFSRERGLAYGI